MNLIKLITEFVHSIKKGVGILQLLLALAQLLSRFSFLLSIGKRDATGLFFEL